ncbi:hypothetical protein AVEN_226411-1 [Araneus ventricosus]|uniref:Uncharacterized protein n=1 Tax=Araneus ventricosus TaxID=182803 RepID=A0A4Y2GZ76_ARAVE|nr:hypothetical protein AVEN_226411-1 [Araneus ventricosus]
MEKTTFKAGHSRALPFTQMTWWHSTPFHFSAHPFRWVVHGLLRANHKPIRYRSLRSPRVTAATPSPLSKRDPCLFVVFTRESLSSPPSPRIAGNN